MNLARVRCFVVLTANLTSAKYVGGLCMSTLVCVLSHSVGDGDASCVFCLDSVCNPLRKPHVIFTQTAGTKHVHYDDLYSP